MPTTRSRLLAVLGAAAGVIALVIGLWAGGTFAARSKAHAANDTGAVLTSLRDVTWSDPSSGGTVVFGDHTARISDVCTTRLSRLTTSAGAFTVRKPLWTSTCSPLPYEPGTAEARRERRAGVFDDVLSGHVTWSRHGRTLRLNGAGKHVTLHATGTAPQLVRTHWTLEQVDNARETLRYSYHHLSLSIAANGLVSASTLCPALQSHAVATDTTVTFTGTEISAEPTCMNPAATKVDPIIVDVLTGVTQYQIMGRRLVLDGAHHDALEYETSG